MQKKFCKQNDQMCQWYFMQRSHTHIHIYIRLFPPSTKTFDWALWFKFQIWVLEESNCRHEYKILNSLKTIAKHMIKTSTLYSLYGKILDKWNHKCQFTHLAKAIWLQYNSKFKFEF